MYFVSVRQTLGRPIEHQRQIRRSFFSHIWMGQVSVSSVSSKADQTQRDYKSTLTVQPLDGQ